MNEETLKELLQGIQNHQVSIEEGIQQIKRLPYEDLGFAKIDHHRNIRQGFPEVIYCAGKTAEQVAKITERLASRGDGNILATRATPEVYQEVVKLVPDAEYFSLPRLIVVHRGKQEERGKILVVSAGTSDLPVAEEAAITAEVMGNKVERIYDTGVAGIHRLLDQKEKIFSARVLIVVAGMEGALASVVGGLVDKPVIAVPTSVGYGASFGGLAALLAMLNSCASGVSVVNIDNGFGAGYQASLINRLGEL
jgi:pyridinium-3,5-biscarboxylic acid mononucleotide synthase